MAPEEPSEWDPGSPRLWLLFSGLAGARIQGGGVIDGSGSKWWANSCKVNKSNVRGKSFRACQINLQFSIAASILSLTYA